MPPAQGVAVVHVAFVAWVQVAPSYSSTPTIASYVMSGSTEPSIASMRTRSNAS